MKPNRNPSWTHQARIFLPQWLLENQKELQFRLYTNDAQKMQLVLECAKANITYASGAPLAAAVFNEKGALLSVGVDTPGIGGHEMSTALLLASHLMGTEKLRKNRGWDLVSLAPPCQVCLGNIYSERPKRFLCAITHEFLLRHLVLKDTLFPNPDWVEILQKREIQVIQNLLEKQAQETLSIALR